MGITGFRRRRYSLTGFILDIYTVIHHPVLAVSAYWGSSLSAGFRQRLMLAVTAVNGCRYCSYFHTLEALRAGLTHEEINFLLDGIIENVPDEEAKGILYAQHWAEHNGKPDTQARTELIATYGAEKSRSIEMALGIGSITHLSSATRNYSTLSPNSTLSPSRFHPITC